MRVDLNICHIFVHKLPEMSSQTLSFKKKTSSIPDTIIKAAKLNVVGQISKFRYIKRLLLKIWRRLRGSGKKAVEKEMR